MKFILMSAAVSALTMRQKSHQRMTNKVSEGDKDVATISCGGGTWKAEVSWTLTCSDGASLSGGAPFNGQVEVSKGSQCTLDMNDSYGDGWNGNNWTGFGKTFTIAGHKRNKSVSFTTSSGETAGNHATIAATPAMNMNAPPVNVTAPPPGPSNPPPTASDCSCFANGSENEQLCEMSGFDQGQCENQNGQCHWGPGENPMCSGGPPSGGSYSPSYSSSYSPSYYPSYSGSYMPSYAGSYYPSYSPATGAAYAPSYDTYNGYGTAAPPSYNGYGSPGAPPPPYNGYGPGGSYTPSYSTYNGYGPSGQVPPHMHNGYGTAPPASYNGYGPSPPPDMYNGYGTAPPPSYNGYGSPGAPAYGPGSPPPDMYNGYGTAPPAGYNGYGTAPPPMNNGYGSM